MIANHSEMGQGIYTGLAMIVAEELDADWSKVRVEPAPADPVYNHTLYGAQITGGSTSTWTEWERLRKAGASARAMLIAAAARDVGRGPASCGASEGHVVHKDSGRRLSYGSLVERASRLSPPKDVALKDPKDFKLIGKPTKRLDTPSKVDGTAVFGLDVTLPGCWSPSSPARRSSAARRRRSTTHGARPCRASGTSSRSIAASPWWPTGSGPPRKGARRSESPGTRARWPTLDTADAGRGIRRARQEAGRRREERRRRVGRDGRGREDARGRLRAAVPRPRADGAAQLRRRRPARRLRRLDRHTVADVRPPRARSRSPGSSPSR